MPASPKSLRSRLSPCRRGSPFVRRIMPSVATSSAVRPWPYQSSFSASRIPTQLVPTLRHNAAALSCRPFSTWSAACSGVRSPRHVLLSATATTGWSGSARPSTITPSSSWHSSSRWRGEPPPLAECSARAAIALSEFPKSLTTVVTTYACLHRWSVGGQIAPRTPGTKPVASLPPDFVVAARRPRAGPVRIDQHPHRSATPFRSSGSAPAWSVLRIVSDNTLAISEKGE